MFGFGKKKPVGTDDDAEAFVRVFRVSTKKKKTLLHHMSTIDFPTGTVTAILGPSGSGKTTLLNTITNNIQSNVEAIAEVHLPGESAFVPQDDRLHGFYTCRKYLHHYARLTGNKIDSNMDQEITNLLTALGLQDQENTIVGDLFLKGLSGGQKRRLSIALEALTSPKNLFLDEPTSGLDAESALQVMKFLRAYARAAPDRKVILTIHQPSSHIWQLIDNVVLLSKGRLMYQGPRSCMEGFFARSGHPTPSEFNPADHYVTIVNDEFSSNVMEVKQWAKLFRVYEHSLTQEQKQSRCSETIPDLAGLEEIHTRRSKSPFVSLELTYRYFLNLWFNPGILGTRVAMYCMLALGVGALFFDLGERTDFQSVQARTAVLFYCVAFFIFMSVAVLPFTVMERAIVDKEVRNGYYNPILYQVAQGISSIPGAAVLAGLTTLIIITMTKLNDPAWYFLIMFLSLCCAEALAQLVSHVVPHFVIGMALLAGLYGFFMLLQGFMLVPSDFPDWLSWSYYVPFHTYAWRVFMYNEFSEDQTFVGSDEFSTGRDVLRFYEIDDVNRDNDAIVLVGYTLVVHLISCFVLYAKYSWFKGTVTPPPDEATPNGHAKPTTEENGNERSPHESIEQEQSVELDKQTLQEDARTSESLHRELSMPMEA